jgi:tryptophanase
LFEVHGKDVLIDLLTDSGTGAMSRDQWASPGPGGREDHLQRARRAREGGAEQHNTHFDTTRANVEYAGAQAVDLLIAQGRDPQADHPCTGIC